MSPPSKRFPDSLVLIFGIIVLAQLLTYVVPTGEFDRVDAPGSSRKMVVAGTYHEVTPDSEKPCRPASDDEDEKELPPEEAALPVCPPPGPPAFLAAIPKGLGAAQDIIFLVFLVGGVIGVLRATGAIDAALHKTVEHLGSSPGLLIGGTMLMFSIGSYTIGMGEEYVPLIPILVTMSLAMKMDAIVAMGMVWIPYGIGWACAGTNPFGVIIAQDIAGVAPTSGWMPRMVLMFLFLIVGFHHLLRYARRIQKDPDKSLVKHVDYSSGFEPPEDAALTPARIAILGVFVAGLVLFVYGVGAWHWYIAELNGVFLAIGLIAAVISKMSPNKSAEEFVRGAAEMTAAALLIGFARGIEVVLSEGQIIDTIIHSIASVLEGTGPEGSATGMLAVQTICNFFIPSGSGQAYVTMPIMSPLATLTGVPQQVAVLAYQFGDGFTNMVVPTSALVMGTLALGRIPYGAWCRFIMPLLGKLFALAVAILIFMLHFGDAVGFRDVPPPSPKTKTEAPAPADQAPAGETTPDASPAD